MNIMNKIFYFEITDLYLSCPAVSNNCTFTLAPSLNEIILVQNSKAIVFDVFWGKIPFTYLK
jgi:hypothetical protein